MPTPLLDQMLAFVLAEQRAAQDRLLDIWHRPPAEKLEKGWTQGFTRPQRGPETATLWAYVDHSDSRLREGDLLMPHGGDPFHELLGRQLSLESEDDERWLLRGRPSPRQSASCWINCRACCAAMEERPASMR